MHRFQIALIAILLAFTSISAEDLSDDFRVDVTTTTPEGQLLTQVYFIGDRAIEVNGGATDGVFDLSGMSWWHESAGDVPLAQCEAWAKASVARTQQSLAGEPDGPGKEFTKRLFEPEFSVTQVDENLVLENPYFRFEIAPTNALSGDRATRLYSYNRLNAYRKAMMGQLPPFAELELNDQMNSRGIAPGTLTLRMTTAAGEMELKSEYTYSAVDKEEATRIQSLLCY